MKTDVGEDPEKREPLCTVGGNVLVQPLWKTRWKLFKKFKADPPRVWCVQSLSRAQLFATPWIIALQAPLSMEFSRKDYWSGLPFPSPGDLPDPGIEHASPAPPSLVGRFFTTAPPGKPKIYHII